MDPDILLLDEVISHVSLATLVSPTNQWITKQPVNQENMQPTNGQTNKQR